MGMDTITAAKIHLPHGSLVEYVDAYGENDGTLIRHAEDGRLEVMPDDSVFPVLVEPWHIIGITDPSGRDLFDADARRQS